jgi:hypothetical protein
MSDRLKRALIRAGKATLAAAVPAAIAQLPSVGTVLPRYALLIPIVTALLLGLEKYLRYTPEPGASNHPTS